MQNDKEHHDPLLRHLTEWTKQVGEQPPSRVMAGIAEVARHYNEQLNALPKNTRLSTPTAERDRWNEAMEEAAAHVSCHYIRHETKFIGGVQEEYHYGCQIENLIRSLKVAAPQGDGETRDAGEQPRRPTSAPVVSAPAGAAPLSPQSAAASLDQAERGIVYDALCHYGVPITRVHEIINKLSGVAPTATERMK